MQCRPENRLFKAIECIPGRVSRSRALHWDWDPSGPDLNLAGAGSVNVAVGRGWWSKKQHVLGLLAVWKHTVVEKKSKAGVYKTKGKQMMQVIFSHVFFPTGIIH